MVPAPSASGRFTSGPLPSHHPRGGRGTLPAQEVALRSVLSVTIASVALGLLAAAARASETAEPYKATVTLARHYTTNALDGPLALDDWYNALRGTLERAVAHDLGATRFTADFELRRFDTYDIEDDAAFGIAAETTIRPSETLELRGTLTLRTVSDGDDMPAGDFILGTRTRKTVLAAALQAGRLVAPDTVLVLEGAASREFAGLTRFQNDVIPPVELEPDRDRLRLGTTLTRTQAPYSYGVSAIAGLRRAHAVGPLPEIVLMEYAAKLQGAATYDNGATFGGAVGLQMLQLLGGAFREMRPTLELTAAMPLAGGFSLRGSVRTAYDTASTDDLLAVWVRRAEAEMGYQASPAVRFALGAFDEQRDNLASENRETVRGLYGEAAWQANEATTILLRVDAIRSEVSVLDIERRVIDAQLAVTKKL